ncbi:MAG TPA: NINE protein [Ktedonobacteraceae bacterium]|nr:NINE protein [Ktedonobacteraceae bacterium]
MDNSRPIDPREPLEQQRGYQQQAPQQSWQGQGPQYPGQPQPSWQGQQPQYSQYPGQQSPYPQYPGQPQAPWQGQQPQWQASQQQMMAPQVQYPGQMMALEPQKSWLTTALLCHFLGYLGVHRFYAGRIASGILQLLTFGGFGIWVLIDIILIVTGEFKDKYGRPLYHPQIIGGSKSWVTTALLCMFLGVWGVHRFYAGRFISGIFQLLTFGGFGIWTLIDLILIYTDNFTDGNGMPLSRA